MSIKPDWAASVWFDSLHIHVQLGKNGHQIKLPNSMEGMHKLLSIIQARHRQSQLNTPGSPTQYQIDLSFDKRLVKKAIQPLKLTKRQSTMAYDILKNLGL